MTAGHRYEGKGGHRRHKVTRKKDDKTISNVVHLGDVTTGQTMLLGKKTYDHTPHDVSCQQSLWYRYVLCLILLGYRFGLVPW